MAVRILQVRDRTHDLGGVALGVESLPDYRNLRRRSLHTHDVIEFNYIIAGTGTYRFDGGDHATGPGCLGIVHLGQAHDILTTPSGMQVINAYLIPGPGPAGGLPVLGSDLGPQLQRILPAVPSTRHRRHRFVHLRFAPGSGLEGILRAMLDEQAAQQPGWQSAMRGHLHLLLVAIARQAAADGGFADLGTGRSDGVLAMIARSIDEHPARPFDLNDLAQRADMTRSSFCRAFRRLTGTTPRAYHMQARIQMAMAALHHGNDRILDVALSCGFSDLSTFNRSFRRIAGASPLTWRKGENR
ncbi:hypothetical protein LBMAG53_17280 [Planctomycetota bacterium]|nr:hypothetical protein LBMAG53_17280 [Planctomycetota bacterium]